MAESKRLISLSGLRILAVILPGLLLLKSARSQNTDGFPLSVQATRVLVDSLALQLQKYYVIPEAGQKMGAYIRKRCKEGAYARISSPHQLAGMLTADVLSVHRDEHFHVEYNPALAQELLGNIDDVPKMVAEKLRQERERNFGFKKVEILPGNVGYVEISRFSRLNKYSATAANAALTMLSNSRAIIIDLRYGTGGSPEMVSHIAGRFFNEKTHLSDIYIGYENVTLPLYAVPDSTQPSLANIPVYILTSYKTFSAAEGLCYALQSRGRAVVVGENTRGGAHTVKYRPLSNGFVTDIPFGRALSPVTKSNWEQKGIVPDIAVPADLALEAAEVRILDKALSETTDSTEKNFLQWQYSLMQASHHPYQADTLTLKKYAGIYGPYVISYSNGELYYQKAGKARFALTPMKPHVFLPKGNDSFSVEFITGASGEIIRIATYYDDARREIAERGK